MRKFLRNTRNTFHSVKGAAAVGAFGLVASPAAFAQVDVGGVVSAIDGALTPIGLIGGAVLLVLVGIKIYKWVRRAM